MKLTNINKWLMAAAMIPLISAMHPVTETEQAEAPAGKVQLTGSGDNTVIRVALLLDTSNSMDGLIEQAKSRLWNIVNTLTTLKFKNKEASLEIALYEYGNDGLSARTNFIRQVAPLTNDLDLISEKLFSLRTNGGSEYCGAVIGEAVDRLSWGNNDADLKLIYIAGNEPFNQGRVSYKETVRNAMERSIYVNTIFCGERMEGIQSFWKDGAEKGGGKYFNIDADKRVRFVETPYDEQIELCNLRLNETYMPYGSLGVSKKANQVMQDQNAGTINKANKMERAVSKSKTVYKNQNWDLVDLMKEDSVAFERVKAEELPAELKGKSKTELTAMVVKNGKERAAIQKQIAALSDKREAYINAAMKKEGEPQDDLGHAMKVSILELAKKKGYTTLN